MHAAAARAHQGGRRLLTLPLAVAGLLLGSCAGKSGVQAPLPVRSDPVRVTIGDHRRVYEFRELRGEVLVLHSEGGDDPLSIPLASVDNLESVVGHRSRGSNALRGAAWGLVFGAGVGAGLGLASGSNPCSPNSGFCAAPEGDAAIGAIVLGRLGATLGLIIGIAHPPTPVWAPVESTALDVQAHASAGELGLQLSWRP